MEMKMKEEVKPEHKKYIDRIRELWGQSGNGSSKIGYDLNPYYHRASESGAVQLLFDYGFPVRLCFAEGSYTAIGSGVVVDTDAFWRLLNNAYTVHVVEPQRDDSKVDRLTYQCGYSGPLVALEQPV
jgi:hypothetical protein